MTTTGRSEFRFRITRHYARLLRAALLAEPTRAGERDLDMRLEMPRSGGIN